MGKTRKKAQKSKAKNNGHKTAATNGKPETSGASPKQDYSVEQIMEKVEDNMECCNFDMALMFCDRAVTMAPDDVDILETRGTILLETGDMDEAKVCFEKCIKLSPWKGFSKYMYLGQMSDGASAVEYYSKGITIMKKELKRDPNAECCSIKDVSTAHCSVAEIYLTDECFSDDADVLCKQHLDEALKLDNKNVEALQLLASYYMSKEDTEKAKETIEASVNLWLPRLKEMEAPIPFLSQMNAAKILIEVANYKLAGKVLRELSEEQDDIADVWYLLGWSNYLQGEEYRDKARLYLCKAKMVTQKVGCEDAGIVEHTENLLKEIGTGDVEESQLENIQHEFESDYSDDEDIDEDDDDDEDGLENLDDEDNLMETD